MGRAGGTSYETAATPRTVVKVELFCEACGERASFDGIGGEWCRECETSQHLVPREKLYRLVEIALD